MWELRRYSPGFDIHGSNKSRPLKEMVDRSKDLLDMLLKFWNTGTIREVLMFCRDNDLLQISDRLAEQLDRQPRSDEYHEEVNSQEKGDWLADKFFEMPTHELHAYSDFVLKNTPYSTQHGVKGEEYPNVLVVDDDIEASWNKYSFSKLFTPDTSGSPTEGQLERGRKLAYVSFSRAQENLRVILFTANPRAAKQELIQSGLLLEEQIRIA